MKKNLLILAALCGLSTAQAQFTGTWTGSSTATTTTDYVGIGTTSPGSFLHVEPNFNGSPIVPTQQAPIVNFAYVDQFNNLNNLFHLSFDGRLGLGTTAPQDKVHLEGGGLFVNNGELAVYANTATKNFKVDANGNVWARHFTVLAGAIPDYVFAKDYRLMSLGELEQFINRNHHLPRIPSAADYAAADGVDMGELQLKLLEKVEELTLYIIELNKKCATLEADLNNLQNGCK